jgi:hypothetical protein
VANRAALWVKFHRVRIEEGYLDKMNEDLVKALKNKAKEQELSAKERKELSDEE